MKRRKAKIEELHFSVNESPMTWMLKMQRLKNEWDSLPEARRGGGIEELIETPVALLSTSPEREDTILVYDPFAD